MIQLAELANPASYQHPLDISFYTKEFLLYQLESMLIIRKSEDIISENTYIKIITSIEDFNDVEKFLEENKIEIMEAKLDFVPENEVEITEFDKALKIKKMIEAFHEDEDVNTVSTNEIIPEELDKEVDEFIVKNTFKS